eukprot:6237045-Pyramimonas_sp.AAC.1
MQDYYWLSTVPKHDQYSTTAAMLQYCAGTVTAPPLQHYSAIVLQLCCDSTAHPLQAIEENHSYEYCTT